MGGRDTTGGTGGSEAGTGGSEAGTGGTGGGEAGTGGVAGESPCECGEKSSDLEPTMVCTFPLELFCLEDDPFECATTLSEAHSHVEARCTPFQEEGGMLSNCADGTTELRWFEFGGDHQLVFDQNGVLVGRAFYGNSNHDFYENVCHGSGVLPDFMDYRAGVPPTWMCGPGCEICGDENACGQGGQPGGGGT
jgi:hypothetical protein